MNTFDECLKFTEEVMVKNKLIYLDTKIVLQNDSFELEQHRKTSNDSTNMMNYRKAIAPRQYKNSCLNGEIYRANNCTSTDLNRDLALKNLTEIFINNEYPRYLIENKIAEIKNRNFGPNPNKLIRKVEEKDPNLKFFISRSLIPVSGVVKLHRI